VLISGGYNLDAETTSVSSVSSISSSTAETTIDWNRLVTGPNRYNIVELGIVW